MVTDNKLLHDLRQLKYVKAIAKKKLNKFINNSFNCFKKTTRFELLIKLLKVKFRK